MEWLRNWRKRRELAALRRHFAFFGYHTDAMSDEELERAVIEACRRFAKVGISASDADAALRRFGLPEPTNYPPMPPVKAPRTE